METYNWHPKPNQDAREYIIEGLEMSARASGLNRSIADVMASAHSLHRDQLVKAISGFINCVMGDFVRAKMRIAAEDLGRVTPYDPYFGIDAEARECYRAALESADRKPLDIVIRRAEAREWNWRWSPEVRAKWQEANGPPQL